MTKSDPSYSDAARKIAEEARLARELFVARCKTMTAEDFLQEPPERLSRLTQAEYADIIRAIAGNPAGLAKPEPPPAAAIVPTKPRRRLRYVWRTTPPVRKAMVVGAMTSVLLIPLFPLLEVFDLIEKPAPVTTMNVKDWPYCHRLDPHQDRCLYRTQNALNWDYVATRLGQELSLLQRNNRHLTETHIPAQALVIVYRPSPTR